MNWADGILLALLLISHFRIVRYIQALSRNDKKLANCAKTHRTEINALKEEK